jgi:hypothetical protein
MKHIRLLLVLFTALAVAFLGAPAASAHEKDKDNGPEVSDVSNAYAKHHHPEKLWVEITYTCDGKNDKGWLDVTLEQDGVRGHGWKHRDSKYEAEDVKATCDDDEQEQWVTLYRVEREDGKKLGYAHNGKAEVEVTLTEKRGDSVTEDFKVRVKGAGHHHRH